LTASALAIKPPTRPDAEAVPAWLESSLRASHAFPGLVMITPPAPPRTSVPIFSLPGRAEQGRASRATESRASEPSRDRFSDSRASEPGRDRFLDSRASEQGRDRVQDRSQQDENRLHDPVGPSDPATATATTSPQRTESISRLRALHGQVVPLFDQAFTELTRQVAVQCNERGEAMLNLYGFVRGVLDKAVAVLDVELGCVRADRELLVSEARSEVEMARLDAQEQREMLFVEQGARARERELARVDLEASEQRLVRERQRRSKLEDQFREIQRLVRENDAKLAEQATELLDAKLALMSRDRRIRGLEADLLVAFRSEELDDPAAPSRAAIPLVGPSLTQAITLKSFRNQLRKRLHEIRANLRGYQQNPASEGPAIAMAKTLLRLDTCLAELEERITAEVTEAGMTKIAASVGIRFTDAMSQTNAPVSLFSTEEAKPATGSAATPKRPPSAAGSEAGSSVGGGGGGRRLSNASFAGGQGAGSRASSATGRRGQQQQQQQQQQHPSASHRHNSVQLQIQALQDRQRLKLMPIANGFMSLLNKRRLDDTDFKTYSASLEQRFGSLSGGGRNQGWAASLIHFLLVHLVRERRGDGTLQEPLIAASHAALIQTYGSNHAALSALRDLFGCTAAALARFEHPRFSIFKLLCTKESVETLAFAVGCYASILAYATPLKLVTETGKSGTEDLLLPRSEALVIARNVFQEADKAVVSELCQGVDSLLSKVREIENDWAASVELVAVQQRYMIKDLVHADDLLELLVETFLRQKAMADRISTAHFHAADVNGDGVLSYQEFRSLVSGLAPEMSASETAAMFREALSMTVAEREKDAAADNDGDLPVFSLAEEHSDEAIDLDIFVKVCRAHGIPGKTAFHFAPAEAADEQVVKLAHLRLFRWEWGTTYVSVLRDRVSIIEQSACPGHEVVKIHDLVRALKAHHQKIEAALLPPAPPPAEPPAGAPAEAPQEVNVDALLDDIDHNAVWADFRSLTESMRRQLNQFADVRWKF
jgi:hypothetical protein